MGIAKRYRYIWKELLIYNDIEFDSRRFTFIFFFVTLNISLVAALLASSNFAVSAAVCVGTFILVHLLAYSYLLLGANSRASKVEEVLPDFLSLMASNIRAGLTPDKALIVSTRDEFGPLTVEVERAGKHSLTGMSLEEVFTGMTRHIRSNALEKTVRLIVEGMESGGNLSELLEKTSLDLRKFRSVRSEINSMILNYVLFIVAAVTFGGPMLYGVSSFLVDIMLKIKQKIGAEGASSFSSVAGQTGIFKGQLLLTPDAVAMFASAAIIITVFFGCMAVGVMYSGRRVDGLKYFPILVLVALGVLFFIRTALGLVLGGIMGA